jgi:hypothetical protein
MDEITTVTDSLNLVISEKSVKLKPVFESKVILFWLISRHLHLAKIIEK